jgi:NADH-quinone oxidoreductase subunit J
VITLGSALLVVTTRNLVHAALWLILALFGVAALFVLLTAPFLAVAQVVIYVGAISILLIFAIMLTRRLAEDTGPQVNPGWGWAALVSVALLGGLVWLLSNWQGLFSTPPALEAGADPLRELGQALVSPAHYVLPFEVASVLLLAALIGAIMVAWERSK